MILVLYFYFPHLLPFCTSMFYKCLHMKSEVLLQSTLRDTTFITLLVESVTLWK